MAATKSENVALFNSIKGPTRPCGWCGRRIDRGANVCRACAFLETASYRKPDYGDALVNGRWVSVRGVQRWVPNAA